MAKVELKKLFKTYNKNLDKSRNQSFEKLFPEETKLYKIVI